MTNSVSVVKSMYYSSATANLVIGILEKKSIVYALHQHIYHHGLFIAEHANNQDKVISVQSFRVLRSFNSVPYDSLFIQCIYFIYRDHFNSNCCMCIVWQNVRRIKTNDVLDIHFIEFDQFIKLNLL